MSEWIKTKDRLPDNMQIVLCILKCGADYEYQVCICQFQNNGFTHPEGDTSPHETDEIDYDNLIITHWMPLPEPPTKD